VPEKSIRQLVLEYFMIHPNKDLSHGPVVDWVEKEYIKLGGTKPRDPWREIRKLHQDGVLIKVGKGIYRYDPSRIQKVELFDFPPEVKEEIFRRDNYRCVVCGRGREDGVEICADHKKPKDKGGSNTVDNGQTLCTEHNLLKKNYSQTEAGKRFIIKIYESAVASGDQRMIRFCKELFDVYDKEGINSHIPRPNHR
jgi:hypothetical protein